MVMINAVDISIRYITGDFQDIGLKEYIIRKLKGNYHVQEFWADRHVNFSLEKGDMLGIIGTNGAGKSTLLKAVSGIMEPSEGKIEVKGNVAALLELASGFDGDLTVKENTYLRGAMLGYTRDFMDEKYEEIITFAELNNFQDRPFKQLSSGMKSRLAFSIACLVKPDILILDEVLSVGDGAFQKKSAERMQAILKSGVTGILVSHSVTQVRKLCNKILWLDHGRQIGFSDKVELYCNAYEEFLRDGYIPCGEQEIYAMSAQLLERKKLAEKQRVVEERKRKESLAKQKAEVERERKESLAKQQAETERKRIENELFEQKRIAELEKLKAATYQEQLQKADKQFRLFNLKELFTDSGNKALMAELVSKYLDNCDYARIDMKNAGSKKNDIVFESISDKKVKITAPEWYGKNGRGYVLDSNAGRLKILARIVGDGQLSINLRGRDVRYTGDNRLPVWITYKSLLVDERHIFNDEHKVCHDSAYKYDIPVKDGQKIQILVDWDNKKLF